MRLFRSLLLLLLLAGCRAMPTGLYSGDLPPSPSTPPVLAGLRVLLDPGHGGPFTGTVGPRGTLEKDVNLDVALELRDLLREAGAEVFLTREEDTRCGGEEGDPLLSDLVARRRMAWDHNPTLFISIHHNGGPPGVNRVETYYKLGNEGASLDLARAIHRRLLECTGIRENFIRAGNYRIMRDNPAICVLLEPSYLTDGEVERALEDPAARRREAYYIFLGILDYVSRGIPRAEYLEPFVVGPDSTIAVRVGPDIDSDTIDVKLDYGYPAFSYNRSSGSLHCRPSEPLPEGIHTLSVFARNEGGNALWGGVSNFKVESSPAGAVCYTGDPVPLGREACFEAYAVDGVGNPVNGPIDVSVRGGRLTRGHDPVCRRFYAAADSAGFGVGLAWQGGEKFFSFPVVAGDGYLSLFVMDGRTGRGIPRCVIDTGPGYTAETNADGHALVRAEEGDELRLSADGYGEVALGVSTTGEAPSRAVAMDPEYGGILIGKELFIDPEGTYTGASQSKLDDFWINLQTSQKLRGLLRRGGARCIVSLRAMSDSEKLKAVEEYEPSIYISIGRSRPPVFYHSPGSREGRKLAESIAAGCPGRPSVEGSAGYLLVQTSMTAVLARFSGGGNAEQEATALFDGILEYLGEE